MFTKTSASIPNHQPHSSPESKFILTINDQEIANYRPEGVTERVVLADLAAVIIETNDSGPVGSDVWFILVGVAAKSGCVFPQGASGEEAVIDYLLKLPNFNHQEFIEAMSSTDNQKFLCWKREL